MDKKKIKITNKQRQYIEAIIYILAIVVVIFANIYGSIYITMLPLLLILGAVGNMIYSRPITTTVFGIVVSLCIAHTKNINLFDNFVLSIVAGFNILLGELLGKYIALCYDKLKKRKKESKKIKANDVKTYSITFIIFIIAIAFHLYTNGNIYHYERCKDSLEHYLQEEYGTQFAYTIIDAKYHFLLDRSFVFMVKNDQTEDVSKYVIYFTNINVIHDTYKQNILAKNNTKLETKLINYLSTQKMYEKYDGYEITSKYNDIQKIELSISKEKEVVNYEILNDYANQVVQIIEEFQSFEEFSNIEQIQLLLSAKDKKDSKVSTIILKNYLEYSGNKVDYILDSFDVEYIDKQ